MLARTLAQGTATLRKNRPKVKRELEIVFRTLGELGLSPILVGGAVRDMVLERPVNDYDFVVQAEPKQLVEALAPLSKAAHCTVIPLDKERGVIRYCFSAEFYVDVAVWQGESLEQDLRARDFTINAVAMDGQGEFLDPTGGLQDLQRGVVRVLGESALDSDPLRVLRGFRMAAVLGFEIEEKTRGLLIAKAPLLSRVAGERISEECFKFFAKADWELMALFQSAKVPDCLWEGETSAETWAKLERWYQQDHQDLEAVKVRADRSARELSILAALLRCRVAAGQDLNQLAERLKLSTEERKFLARWMRATQSIEDGSLKADRDRYRLIRDAGNALAGVLSFTTLEINRDDLRWEPLPMTGGELCQRLGRQPGRWVGEVLQELELRWACKEVQSAADLWEAARELVPSDISTG